MKIIFKIGGGLNEIKVQVRAGCSKWKCNGVIIRTPMNERAIQTALWVTNHTLVSKMQGRNLNLAQTENLCSIPSRDTGFFL